MNRYSTIDGKWQNYDKAGNLTRDKDNQYAYDYAGRLVQIITRDKEIRFFYDALSRRVRKEVVDLSGTGPTVSAYYAYDGDEVIEESDSNGAAGKRYVYDEDGTPISFQKWLGEATTATYYYCTNVLGSVMAVSNAAGALVESYLYGAFGELLSVTDVNGNPIEEPNRIGNPVGAFGMWLVEGVEKLLWAGAGLFFNPVQNVLLTKGGGTKKTKKITTKKTNPKLPFKFKFGHLDQYLLGLPYSRVKGMYEMWNKALSPKFVAKAYLRLTEKVQKKCATDWQTAKGIMKYHKTVTCKGCDCKEVFKAIKFQEFTIRKFIQFLHKGNFTITAWTGFLYRNKLGKLATAGGYRSKKLKKASPCLQWAVEALETDWAVSAYHSVFGFFHSGLHLPPKGLIKTTAKLEIIRNIYILNAYWRVLVFCCTEEYMDLVKRGGQIKFTVPTKKALGY